MLIIAHSVSRVAVSRCDGLVLRIPNTIVMSS